MYVNSGSCVHVYSCLEAMKYRQKFLETFKLSVVISAVFPFAFGDIMLKTDDISKYQKLLCK